MTVKCAVQILIKTIFIALSQYGSPDTSETVRFCYMTSNFFDCLNARSTTEAVKNGITFFNLAVMLMIKGYSGLEIYFYITLTSGKKILKQEEEISLKLRKPKCSYLGKPTKVFKPDVNRYLNVCPFF